MRKLQYTLFLLVCLGISVKAEPDSISNPNLFSYEFSYIGDALNNFSGGIRSGSCFLGFASVKIKFDTKSGGFWENGTVFLNASNTHGALPSAIFLGDYQISSNIQAGDHSYIQELWYKQSIGNFDLTAGLQDLNVEFINSSVSSNFINSSFGVMPILSGNLPSPIFPLTSLGLTAKWSFSENMKILAAVYDGSPTDFNSNKYNLTWDINEDDGLFSISELQLSSDLFGKEAIYKIGLFYHNHYEKSLDNNTEETVFDKNYGIYFITDQNIWESENKVKNITGFIQLGLVPKEQNKNYIYSGFGVNYNGIFNNKNDYLGIAVANAVFKNEIKSETTIEFTYKAHLTDNISLQPDIQYIINPAGEDRNLDNAFVGIIRLGFRF